MADNLLDDTKTGSSALADGDYDVDESEKEELNDESLRCGWRSWRPECLQKFINPKWFILFISMFSLVQGLAVMGLVAVSIPDIEKEFGFTSTHSGLILAFNDIAGIILVPIISFFGTTGKKPKWIGYGALITGLGALLFALPKALKGKYEIPGLTIHKTICVPNGGLPAQCDQKSSTSGYLVILCLAQFVMGAGTTPLYTLGPTYLDENVNPKVSPVYLGVWFATTFLGPGLGYIVGGTFLKMFTNGKMPDGMKLSAKDPRWVGAWWLGFFVLAWLLFLSGAALLCFPAEMPKFRKKRDEALKKGELQSAEKNIGTGIRGFFKAILNLSKNWTFVFASLGLTFRVFYASSLGSFLAKVIILKFGGSSYKTGMMMGAVLLSAMAVGILVGSYVMKRLPIRNSAKSAALICLAITLFRCCGSAFILIPGCNTSVLAALLWDLCFPSATTDAPVHVTYTTLFVAVIVKPTSRHALLVAGFTNCSCIPKLGLHPNASFAAGANNSTKSSSVKFEATRGTCDRQCKNLTLFLIAVFFLIFISFFSATPQKMIILRCVPDNQRAFALGLQFLLMRSLSFIPGPVIFGHVIDSQCILWKKDECGKSTNCLDYHVDSLSKNIFYLGLTCGIKRSCTCPAANDTLCHPERLITLSPSTAIRCDSILRAVFYLKFFDVSFWVMDHIQVAFGRPCFQSECKSLQGVDRYTRKLPGSPDCPEHAQRLACPFNLGIYIDRTVSIYKIFLPFVVEEIMIDPSVCPSISWLPDELVVISTVFYFLAWFLYKPPLDSEKAFKFNAEEGALVDDKEKDEINENVQN
eukprot:gene569-1227_t